MQYLVDTGVLLRLFDRTDSQHQTIRNALRSLRLAKHEVLTCPQNIAEFWNVSTRPAAARGGYGHSVQTTERRVAFIERCGSLIPESRASYREWRKLVVAYQIQGVSVHDARLVSVMIAHNITNIITLNGSDFARYSGIQVFSPQEALDSV